MHPAAFFAFCSVAVMSTGAYVHATLTLIANPIPAPAQWAWYALTALAVAATLLHITHLLARPTR